jgi:F-type H+-transporting ATPase subunit delta
MNGASREALSAARESLDALTDNTSVDATKLADELAAVLTQAIIYNGQAR